MTPDTGSIETVHRAIVTGDLKCQIISLVNFKSDGHFHITTKSCLIYLTYLTVLFGEYLLSETMYHASQTGPSIQLNTVTANLAIND